MVFQKINPQASLQGTLLKQKLTGTLVKANQWMTSHHLRTARVLKMWNIEWKWKIEEEARVEPA